MGDCRMAKYDPILNFKTSKTKTFQIANLFYIALIGGSISLMIFGFWNAHTLHLKRKAMILLGVSSFCVFSAKVIVYYLIGQHVIPLDQNLSITLYRLPDLLLFVIFYHILKIPYRYHLIYHGDYQLMLYQGRAAIICLLGFVMETVLIGLFQ
jgi:hypothetical protein